MNGRAAVYDCASPSITTLCEAPEGVGVQVVVAPFSIYERRLFVEDIHRIQGVLNSIPPPAAICGFVTQPDAERHQVIHRVTDRAFYIPVATGVVHGHVNAEP